MAGAGAEMTCRRCKKGPRNVLFPCHKRLFLRALIRKHVTTHRQKQSQFVCLSMSMPECLLVRCPASPQTFMLTISLFTCGNLCAGGFDFSKKFPSSVFILQLFCPITTFALFFSPATIEYAITFYANGKTKKNQLRNGVRKCKIST